MTRSLLVATLLFLTSALPAPAQQIFRKVLFIGNSLTHHGPKTEIEWQGNWGMAASEEAKDYVHVFSRSLTERQGVRPEISIKNTADFERAYLGYDVATKLRQAIGFHADLIVLAIGENVPALKSDDEKTAFQNEVTKLLVALKAGGRPTLLVRSCFWANTAKDKALKQACEAAGGIFVDISALSKDVGNYARSERTYKHAGVGNHPGDKGMAAISEALLMALPK